MRRLKCFVACAFGKQDVDELYTKVIVPTLESMNIDAQRVDKINHNSKIDSKILDLIEKCDFAIADLTYARPSVYYEAGRVEGLGRTVIYIAREDHTRPQADDANGNRRIHFDLITQNLTLWNENFDMAIGQTLRNRILLVSKPIQSQLQTRERNLKDEKQFQQKSQSERIELLKIRSQKLLSQIKIKFAGKKVNGRQLNLMGIVRKNRKDQFVMMYHANAYSKRTIENLLFLGHPFVPRTTEVNHKILFCVSLARISTSVIESALRTFRKTSDENKIYSTETEPGKKLSLCFIDGIKSVSDYNEKLAGYLKELSLL